MNKKLMEPVFRPLGMNEIKPEGWLLNQLRIQANGLSGNLDKFWPDIKESKWFGGDKEGWERVPYWLDGFIPLAWLIDDEEMKNRAKKYINYIIEHQKEDGWICPDENINRNSYDMWALFLILKVLVVYYDATGDERIEDVVRKALLSLDRHIDTNMLFNWGQSRWFEGLISIWWLYERTEEEWLLKLASKLHAQGFNWIDFFKNWPYEKSEGKGKWSQMSHVVNNAMMLKSSALLWRMTGKDEHLNSAEDMAAVLDKYHGMVTGMFTGDECLAGKSPVQGTELCSVAEYMYSLEHLISITGKSHWGDRLEKIAYNALPATFSPDMWAHQYVQQVNQVQCSIEPNPVFNTNGGESNLFGLEPNYGCCTANLSQAWPKFALSTIMKAKDGMAITAYAPVTVNTKIGGTSVKIQVDTQYPFRDEINFKVTTDKSSIFALYLRIPAWCKNAELVTAEGKVNISNNGFYKIVRDWEGQIKFTLNLPMTTEIIKRSNDLYAVCRGPLVYSLKIGEKWTRVNEDRPYHEYPHCDYEVYPTTSWNYGLCLDKDYPDDSIKFKELPFGDYPFSPDGAPIVATVKGKKIDWRMENGSAAPYPDMESIADEDETIELIPYGCTNLRLTEMPII